MSTKADAQAAAIRPALREDAARICELHLAAVRSLCAPHYEREIIDGWLRGRVPDGYIRGIESGTMFVAESAVVVVGFGQAKPGEVVAVFVDPNFVGRGIGALLLTHALARAAVDGRPVKVEATLNAVAFYERFGFHAVGRSSQRRNDVDVPVVVMERHAG